MIHNVTFTTMPAFPVLFLLHKQKLTSCHKVISEQFSKLFPKHAYVPIVVDDEVVINKAIAENTQLYLVGCWRHLGTSTERWVAGVGGTRKEQHFYKEEFITLLRCTSFKSKSSKWSQPFVPYFEEKKCLLQIRQIWILGHPESMPSQKQASLPTCPKDLPSSSKICYPGRCRKLSS